MVGQKKNGPSKDFIKEESVMKLNLKGIVKSVIAGCTIIGGAVLGNEARKCFTKPLPNDEELDDNELFCEDCEEAESNPAEEAADDEPDEVPED